MYVCVHCLATKSLSVIMLFMPFITQMDENTRALFEYNFRFVLTFTRAPPRLGARPAGHRVDCDAQIALQ